VTQLIEKLENRVKEGFYFGNHDSPRVLVTGCPIGGDATKIFNLKIAIDFSCKKNTLIGCIFNHMIKIICYQVNILAKNIFC
jgi:benzoyl-CoA reductase/2-hydroxyglutaryl-CoA dehydratase subunit BcrC/BadD/HgdB